MKTLMARLVGITLLIAPTYGYAQICEAEIQEIERVKKLGGLGSLVGNHYPFVKTYYPLDKPGTSVRQIVNSEIKWLEKRHCSRINFSESRANLKAQIVKKEDMLKQWKRNESESIKRWAGNEKSYHQAVLSEYAVLAYWKYTLCVWDTHNITIKCKSSHSTSTQNLNSITSGDTQSPNPTHQPRKTNPIENASIAKVNQPARP